MGRTKRDWSGEYKSAIAWFDLYKELDDVPSFPDEWPEMEIRLQEVDLTIEYPEPGPVTVKYADGTVEQRAMTDKEMRAWQETLDPELDVVKGDG